MSKLINLIWFFIRITDFIVFSLFMYLLSFAPKALISKTYINLFQKWCQCFIQALGIDLAIHQKFLHDLPKQYIVISNHPSAFEDIGMPSAFKAIFLAKSEVRTWFVLGRISEAAGTVYVKRDSKESRTQAMLGLGRLLETGHNIGLYPEGGCKGKRIHLPFYSGAFELSIKYNIPIVPVFLHYEAQDDFVWKNQSLVGKIWDLLHAKNKRANYYIHDALYPENFENKDELMQQTQALYIQWQQNYL
ncbi:MAG: lysophospholipid acyltransferase family protein [Gammaproteobacteria bacterium]